MRDTRTKLNSQFCMGIDLPLTIGIILITFQCCNFIKTNRLLTLVNNDALCMKMQLLTTNLSLEAIEI